MLVEIDPSIAKSVADEPNGDAAASVAIAAQAEREGNHVLWGNLSDLESLINSGNAFDERTRSCLAHVRNQLPQRGALAHNVARFARLTAADASGVKQEKGRRVILLGANQVARASSLLGRAALLVENLTDADVYRGVIEAMLSSGAEADFRGPISFDPVNGGGATIAAVYQSLKDERRRLVLAIADSDRAYDGAPLGETAKRLLSVDSVSAEEGKTESMVLEVRSIENLLPAPWLVDLSSRLDLALGCVVRDVVACHASIHWSYLPLKKGMKCFDVSTASKPEREYWCSATGFSACPNASGNCADREACSTYIFGSCGGGLSGKVRDHRIEAHHVRDCRNELVASEWVRLTALFKSWFCGCEPRYS